LKHANNLHFIASTRHFTGISIDEPKSFNGTDKGPSPIEYFLIAIGSCIGNTFIFCLNKNNIELNNLELVVDGKLKHVGPKLRLRLVSIECDLILTPKYLEDLDIITKCEKEFRDHCILLHSVSPVIQINVKIQN